MIRHGFPKKYKRKLFLKKDLEHLTIQIRCLRPFSSFSERRERVTVRIAVLVGGREERGDDTGYNA